LGNTPNVEGVCRTTTRTRDLQTWHLCNNCDRRANAELAQLFACNSGDCNADILNPLVAALRTDDNIITACSFIRRL
jgi:hypothetical protein